MVSNHSSSNDTAAAAGLGIVLVFGAAIALIWKFSTLLGVDFATGSAVALRLVGVAVLCGAIAWGGQAFGFDGVPLQILLPCAFVGVWIAFFPALDHWALAQVPSFMQDRLDDRPWWAAWYTKAGGAIGIGASVYGLTSFFNRR